VARALIVGCGCRGRELGAELASREWQVRGTSRSPEGREAIEAAGLEAAEADPDRPGTVLELCGDTGVVVWLLGAATGDPADLDAIHGSRLERLLEKLVDTPVRGFVYEGAGPGDAAERLDGGRQIAERAAQTWRIPVVILDAQRDEVGWAASAADAVERSLLRA
jgi:nucleoside-diphosphate-sugar epimerase